MKKFNVLLLAFVFLFAACSKDDDGIVVPQENNYNGSFEVVYNGQTLSTLNSDVIFVNDYAQVNLGGLDQDNTEFTMIITGVGTSGNTVNISDDNSVLFTYKGQLLSAVSGTIERVDENQVDLDVMVAPVLDETNTTALTAEIHIGRFTNL